MTQALASPDLWPTPLITRDGEGAQRAGSDCREVSRTQGSEARNRGEQSARREESDLEMKAYARKNWRTGSAHGAGARGLESSALPKDPMTRKRGARNQGRNRRRRGYAVAPRSSACTRATRRRAAEGRGAFSSESGVAGEGSDRIIEGQRVYSQMKYEAGASRAARSGHRDAGRVHTSAVTVAICRRPRMWTSKSKPRICASILSALPGRAGSR